MADRPRGGGGPAEGTPEYQWLYGNRGGGAPGGDEPTRAMPGAARGEETRVMPTMSRGSDASDFPPSVPPPPRRDAEQPAKPPRRRRRPGLRLLRWLLLLWIVFLLAVPFWAWTKVAKVDATPAGQRPNEQPGTTYLLVGSDSRGDLTAAEREELGTGGDVGQRTDTIMLLHVGSGPNLLMSVPRDSIVPIPGHSTTKINAAYAWGGPKLLVRTLETTTGIRIDHYVEIGFGGFVDMVDAVGGVEICPKRAMKDPQANLDIPKGCQEVDGKTALGYARSRKTYTQLGDIDRARAQREVVAAVGSEATSPWTFINPVRYWRLAMATAESFTVGEDDGPLAIARFGWAMTRVDGEKGLTCGIPIRDLAVNWDTARAEQLFSYIIDDNTEDIPAQLCTDSGLPD